MHVHSKFKRNAKVEDLYFINPVLTMTEKSHSLKEALAIAESYMNDGYYVVNAITYESFSPEGEQFIIGVFDEATDHETFISTRQPGAYEMTRPEFTQSRDEIIKNIEQVRDYIRDGHTYQVNYTTRLKGRFRGDGHTLFETLMSSNNGDYAMYIEYGDEQIVSCSPELFFEVDAGRKIRTRPMKGTAPRGETPAEDERNHEFLKASKKDRAENVMIVDLLRNDISKVAAKNSVNVPALFTIEEYATVFQMTSTVEADLREDTGINDIMAGLFPCGSITGAPKMSTMNIINALEATDRKYYCGTLGMMYPGGESVFNVPIRTLYIDGENYIYGAGGGITYDSIPASEYDEIVAKTAFLKNAHFRLIESMRLEDGMVRRLDRHAARMAASADHFNFKPSDLRAAVLQHVEFYGLKHGIYKLRATQDEHGEVAISHSPIEDEEAAGALLHRKPMYGVPEFIENKTTVRYHYKIPNNDFKIILYYNEDQQLTEFNIGNLVIMEDGDYFTPSAGAGILNGVMRQSLIDERKITEKDYMLDDFIEKHESGRITVYLINSVRGWVKIRLTIQR
ncbi:aminodeoxychorismate synthase component I [Lacicoccus alkaliphilus]|uniref:Para-aminobenzoate synthetase / 4-amino-4-deoxychorismate lyase n=1 Tax=Lacicoccus alkaliphilus DSM 16010 TaxID=1123231 RepID=A0A1M7F5Y8_9BACL|nr:aminodeoxychorismate synthase component I [Salinicoccus alkaliphilus]SHL99405.1 para-aminobenzoate synthetase / 4-amino-4-deoxychorismate lyase [Salinicoccus alkaliphilus DSM 16010]